MSKIFVDQVDPKTATTLTLGTSGDTVSIPSGVTIANSGTATGFGTTLSGSTNNTVATVTGANALQGETNFIYNGTIVGAGADGANADLGVGVNIKTADSGASANADGDELVIEGSGNSGISILTSATSSGNIIFGDDTTNDQGKLQYHHNGNYMMFETDGAEKLRILSTGGITFNAATAAADALDDYEEGTWTPTLPSGGTVTSVPGSKYTKIGNVCYVWAAFQFNSIPSDSTLFKVGGLPFTSAAAGAYGSGSIGYANLGGYDWSNSGWNAALSATYIYWHKIDNSTATINNSDVTGMTQINVGGFYFTG